MSNSHPHAGQGLEEVPGPFTLVPQASRLIAKAPTGSEVRGPFTSVPQASCLVTKAPLGSEVSGPFPSATQASRLGARPCRAGVPGHEPPPTCSLVWHMVRFWSSQEQATRMYLSQLPAPACPASTQNFSPPRSSETCPGRKQQSGSEASSVSRGGRAQSGGRSAPGHVSEPSAHGRLPGAPQPREGPSHRAAHWPGVETATRPVTPPAERPRVNPRPVPPAEPPRPPPPAAAEPPSEVKVWVCGRMRAGVRTLTPARPSPCESETRNVLLKCGTFSLTPWRPPCSLSRPRPRLLWPRLPDRLGRRGPAAPSGRDLTVSSSERVASPWWTRGSRRLGSPGPHLLRPVPPGSSRSHGWGSIRANLGRPIPPGRDWGSRGHLHTEVLMGRGSG